MLNCVGISLEKQQTWLGWLTISLSSDTTRRKPVSCLRSRTERSSADPGLVSMCMMMLMLHSVSHMAKARLGNTFFFSH